MRVGGTYDADTSEILTVTAFGQAAGLQLGPIPVPIMDQTGVYLVCQNGASNVNLPNVAGEIHTPGDWIVAINQTWEFINIGQGGGGGGGAQVLIV